MNESQKAVIECGIASLEICLFLKTTYYNFTKFDVKILVEISNWNIEKTKSLDITVNLQQGMKISLLYYYENTIKVHMT